LTGVNTNLVIYDNIQAGRNSNGTGDIQLKGTANGKSVDFAYWENQRRGADEVKKKGMYYLKTVVDGEEKILKSDQGFLANPLVMIKKK
jgi:ribosomal protein S11